jgi:catechol 2,3-dioxygenase-like lactoylglutathione lyase family enzyme
MISQLGYLAFEVSDLAAWEAFATGVLGLEVARRWDGGLSLRMDGHAERFFLTSGPADDLAAMGWEVADEAALDAVAARLRAAGHEVSEANGDEAAGRRVVRMVTVRDPAGTRVEIAFGPAMADEPFVSRLVPSGFVADEHGMGHLVCSAPDPRASAAF